jgi:tape measure domain-containing protein
MAVDDKVVAISFESSRFEQGVNRTISALEKLKAALHFPNAGKGLSDIDAAAKKVDFSHMGRAIDSIKDRLSAFRLVAIGVLTNIANQAVHAAARFAKAFTIDPIKAGFAEYATNLNAVQTILANTQAAGTKLKDVNAALKELNEYSDKTIYNFSQMAKNIGTFTAAGVELDTATGAIKGIANLAALSGSTADQASTAMYQLSQAISAGRVSLQDWNSVVNAGMGGTVFQRALAQTAVAMGTLKDGSLKLVGPMKNVSIAGESFRQSLQAGPGKQSWLTSKVLTATLEQFTGDLSKAELAAMGFNAAQIKAIQATAKTAMHAATEVKTLTQVLDVAKETAQSGWAETWQIIFGNFGEAKTTFTALSNAINGFISANADARNKVLSDWKALGGRTVLIEGIKNAFNALKAVIAPIKQAFRDIFPATTGKNLYDLTVRFRDFTAGLKPSAETVENLKRTFRGFFALLSIGGQLLSGIFGVFKRLFGVVTDGAGGFLNFTGNIGDFLVAVDQALKKGHHFERFFAKLGDILAVPAELIKTLSGTLIGLFSGALPGTLAKQMSGLGESMSPLQAFVNNLAKQWNALLTKFSDTARALQPAFNAVMDLISGIGVAIGEAASNMNFDAILQVIRTGLLAGLVYMLKNFFGKGSFLEQISKGFGGGILSNIAGSFKALEGSMVAMQQNIKAKTLKEIAIAIALLAASVLVLSLIDPKKLNASLGALAITFGQLLGAMAILGSVSKSLGFIKMPVIAAALILLAGAIVILSAAVLILSRLSWEELAKGLSGVAVLLGAIALAAGPLSANSAGMIRAGIGITGIAIALNLLALAVRQMSSLSLAELGKGLLGVAVGLAVLVAGMRLMPPGMALSGIGLVAIAFGLKILASAVKEFSMMDWSTMGKGMAGIAAGLVIIAGAMHLMPKGMVVAAAGLLIVSFALGKIADVITKFGGLSITEIAKGLGTLAGALILLAAALYVMSGTIGGAVALGLAAAGLALLAPALVAMGKQSWEAIIKGIVGLAAALTIIGIAGALVTPVIPSLLGLGAALLLIGAGLALAGAGIFLIATGLSALVVAAPAGVGILVAAFNELVQGIIESAKNLVLGVLEIAKAFAEMAPQFVEAGITVFKSLLDGLVQALPMIEETLTAVVDSMVRVLKTNTPKIVQAGMDFIIAFLEGIKANVDTIINLIIDIIQLIIVTIVGRFFAIFAAGGALLRKFTDGIISAIAQVPVAALRIITSFLTTIAGALGRIATSGLSVLTRFVTAITGALGRVVTAATSMITSLVSGITSGTGRVVAAATQIISRFVSTISQQAQRLVSEGRAAVGKFISGVLAALGAAIGTVKGVARSVGAAIIDGMTGGLMSKAGDLYGKIQGVMDKAMSLMHKVTGVFSPSVITHEIGVNLIRGLVLGMDQTAPEAYNSATTVSRNTVRKFAEVFRGSKVMMEIGKFVMKDFALGLQSGEEGVNKVWKELNQKLVETAATARKTIAEEQKKLKELMAADKQDAEAIKKSQDILKENQRILAQSLAGHTALTGALQKQKSELLAISKQYDMVSNSLKLAQDKLKELEQAQVDAMKSFRDQYATLPELSEEEGVTGAEQLANYLKALQDQTAAVAKYHETLEQLRALGLDDETYQKLLEEGTADQEFAEALLAGGETAIEGLNELDRQLMTESEKLAISASKNLHQAGIDAASGLIKGLKSQKQRLIREMEDMADEIVAAFNRRLKIKSPSQVFAEIGGYVIQGFAKGITDSKKVVANALDDAAQAALAAMKSSMRNISDVVSQELNPNPVITPVLDLTQVRTQAQELGVLTNVTPITAAASYNQASLISAAQLASQSEEAAVAAGAGAMVKFEQNNYSPESLTEIEIYRQTKNQLSQLKSALSVT